MKSAAAFVVCVGLSIVACGSDPPDAVRTSTPERIVGLDSFRLEEYYDVWNGDISLFAPLPVYQQPAMDRTEWRSLVDEYGRIGLHGMDPAHRRRLLQGVVKTYVMRVENVVRKFEVEGGGEATVTDFYREDMGYYVLFPGAHHQRSEGVDIQFSDAAYPVEGSFESVILLDSSGGERWEKKNDGPWDCTPLAPPEGFNVIGGFFDFGFHVVHPMIDGTPGATETFVGRQAIAMDASAEFGTTRAWLDSETLLPIALSIPRERGPQQIPARTIRTLSINAAPTVARPEPGCE